MIDQGRGKAWEPPPGGLTTDEVRQLWDHVAPLNPLMPVSKQCWTWTGEVNGKYPSFKYRGAQVSATRLMWVACGGGQLPGRLMRVRCDEKQCVNPGHFIGGIALDKLPDGAEPKGFSATDGRAGPSHDAWQLPDDCTPAEARSLIVRVRERILQKGELSMDGHWSWSGSLSGSQPGLMFRGKMISAARAAWAIHRGGVIPRRLVRHEDCTKSCVNPRHFGSMWDPAHPDSERASPPGNPAPLIVLYTDVAHQTAYAEQPVAEASAEDGQTFEEIASGFRALDALSALTFGTTPAPYVPRRLIIKDDEPIQTADGPLELAQPVGLNRFEPTPKARARFMPVSVEELLAIVFTPNTLVVTYPSGSVLISTPGARVIAPDAEAAIQAVLLTSGARKVVER